jgi:hypothetical protein
MGCVNSQQKLDQFQKNANQIAYDSGSAATVSNRYAVSSPDDDKNDIDNFNETSENINNNNNNNANNNADEMSMYTNISDFEVEKNLKNKKKNRNNKNSENSSQDVDADLDAFKNSMKNKKKSRKQKTSLILNNSSAKLPGTELGVYDQSSNKMKFTGGIQNA